MNQLQFNSICEAAARALHVEATPQDGRYSFSVDETEILQHERSKRPGQHRLWA